MARRTYRWFVCLFVAFLAHVVVAVVPVDATTDPASACASPSGAVRDEPRMRIFLDCAEADCDFDFLRRELPWLDWVLDRHDSDVDVLVTRRASGGGGSENSLCFLRRPGRGPAADTLSFYLSPETTSDGFRRALAQALAAGLARDLIGTPQGARLELRVPAIPKSGTVTESEPAGDRWRGWVLRTSLGGTFNGERTYRNGWVNSALSATRVRESSKVRFGATQGYNEGRYELSDGSLFTTVNRSWSVSARGVRSLSPRWSAGGRAWTSSSTYSNEKIGWGVGPTFEYDLFPYAESDRRSLTLAYQLLATWDDYRVVTLYGKTHESLLSHHLVAALDLRQPWGTASFTFWASQYLHDADLFRLTAQASAELRLCRGLSFKISGTWERIHDQISLPADDATDDEILARQRELATTYRYYASIGVSYTFGAILNNVVNPRLDEVYGSF